MSTPIFSTKASELKRWPGSECVTKALSSEHRPVSPRRAFVPESYLLTPLSVKSFSRGGRNRLTFPLLFDMSGYMNG